MRIGVVTSTAPLSQGLHRDLARGLEAALRAHGHRVERILLPVAFGRDLLEQAWAFRAIALTDNFDRIIALRPPAHLVVHPHKVLWLSAHDGYGGVPAEDGAALRLAVADRTALLAADRVFATSEAAAERWRQRAGLRPGVLPPPAPAPCLAPAPAPGGRSITALHPGPSTADAGLAEVTAALRLTRPEVRVHFCGGANDPLVLEEIALRAAVLPPGRLLFDRDRPSPPWLAALMAEARAVLCLAADDDVALACIDRAAAAGLPAIVNRDCPAAMERIVDGETGIGIPLTDTRAIAAALDRLAAEPAWAAAMGEAAAQALAARPGWDAVLDAMLGA
ncbi:glycosyltransferase involved in cell wall biosynthesis [Humitalea rosea]|uniref:Glycosyltransferase involved in cell wall biosynthesis n=1 Tax=Humitalea rosea TaxID=990373 RepID=A0A2W7IGS5_9PROT|nr:glycosyltransferase [Humitalea rosea]PZW45971.1 glycosyltransferase involved in cell wall biosynthesis [Humitalea rosea]